MTRPEIDPVDREERLDRAIAEFLEESGTNPGADRRQWLSRYPEFFDELSDFFADRDEVEKLAAPLRDLARSADLAPDDAEWLGPSEVPDHLGRIGDYEVVDRVGRGGMGVVYKGHDAALNRYVAIKALAPQWASDPAARRRFTRKAQAAAAVSHPHVVTIHAVGEWRARPYLVMEFVTGASLQQRIDEAGPVELKELLRIGVQVASGLAAAHAQGLIHRDIKPSNIMLENDLARVKLTDFGLARAVDDARLTQYGTLAGTPAYMAPEQARGEPMDRRSDLFSLGSVLYAMATGRAAFRGESSVEVLRRVSDGDPPPVRELNPEVPEWLAEIVGRLHAKDPADRFPSTGEVADLLERHLAGLQDASLPPVEHPWVRRPSRIAIRGRALARRLGARRLAVPLLLLAVAGGSAGLTRCAMQSPPHAPQVSPSADGTPSEDRLRAAYWCNFRDGRYDYRWLHLEPNGPLTALAKPDRRGFRITIPPKTDCRGIGAFTMFGVHGDFDIIASFEILRADRPKEGGGVGPELYLRTVNGWGDYISMARLLRTAESDPQILIAWGEKVNGQPRYHGTQEKTALKAGQFRITRVGSTVRYFIAPRGGDDFRKGGDDFREIYRHEFGTKDLDMVRIMGQVNESRAGLDIVWKDLSIAAEALPGFTDGSTPESPPRSWWWPLLGGLVGVTVLAVVVHWTGSRRADSPHGEGPRTMTTETRVRESRWDWGLAAAAAVALACRLPYLTERSFWYDESSSWQTAKFSFPEMIRSARLNVHLPLYYTLLKGWMSAWGESVASIRGFSITFGVLTVVAMGAFAGELYRASAVGDGRESDRRWFARVVALLVAISPYQSFLSLEARMYSLGTTFAALGAWLLLRALREPARGRPWWAFGTACAGMLYTHHYGLFTVASWYFFLGLYAARLMMAGDRPEARAVVAGASRIGAVVAAAYLPGLALLRTQVARVQQDYWIPEMTWRIFSGTFSQFLLPTYAFDFLIGGCAVFGVLAVACLVVLVGGRRGEGLVLASGVGPLVLAAGVSTFHTIVWHHRYFVFAHLFLLSVLAMAIWKLTRRLPAARWAMIAAIVAVLAWGQAKYWDYFDVTHRTGVKGAIETILAHRRGDEMIVTFDHHQYFPMKFYAGDRATVRIVDPGPDLFWGWHLIRPDDLIEPDRLRDELRRGIWIVGKDPTPWERPVLSGAEPVERYEFRHYHSVHRHLHVFHLRSAGRLPANEGTKP